MRPLSLLETLDQDFGKLFYPQGDSKWKPFSRVREEHNLYHLSLDIPGVDKEHLKVELKENLLCIKGERRDSFWEEGTQDANFFEQQFSLPKDSNISEIEVSQNNGVLDIVIPKRVKEVETKVFSVKDGENSYLKVGSN